MDCNSWIEPEMIRRAFEISPKRTMHDCNNIYYLIPTRDTTDPGWREDLMVLRLWALVQVLEEHDYLVHCAS